MWEKTMEKMDCYVLICSKSMFGSYLYIDPAMYETT